jgi:hypothetical protein
LKKRANKATQDVEGSRQQVCTWMGQVCSGEALDVRQLGS